MKRRRIQKASMAWTTLQQTVALLKTCHLTFFSAHFVHLSTSNLLMPGKTLFAFALSLLAHELLAVSCYHPNGDPVIDSDYHPCNPAAPDTVSSCCATSRSLFPDICLPNGLCGNGDDVFRDSCTDPTWKSPLCPQLCTAGVGQSGEDIGDPRCKRVFHSTVHFRNGLSHDDHE